MIRRCSQLAVVCWLGACGPASDHATWSLDLEEDAGVLLSVWGSGPADVWAAGGQAGQGLLLHNEGGDWQRVEAGADELLWWVYGFGADDVYAVGEQGLIVHYDGSGWSRVESGTDATLYGIWGASGDDVWIVGGNASGPPGSAVVLHGSNRQFELDTAVPPELLPNALFKVYGDEESVIIVGARGTVLRFSNGAWERESAPTDQPIFSLWGRADDDIYAVGGFGSGEVLHFDGREWSRFHEGLLSSGLSGVFAGPHQPTIAVGEHSYVVEIDADGKSYEPQLPTPYPIPTLHGVWGDGAGTTYAVGGDLFDYPAAMGGVVFKREQVALP